MRKFAPLVATFVLALPLAWVGGELHRRNCETAHRDGCSVLPWVAGHQSDGWGSGATGPCVFGGACGSGRKLYAP